MANTSPFTVERAATFVTEVPQTLHELMQVSGMERSTLHEALQVLARDERIFVETIARPAPPTARSRKWMWQCYYVPGDTTQQHIDGWSKLYAKHLDAMRDVENRQSVASRLRRIAAEDPDSVHDKAKVRLNHIRNSPWVGENNVSMSPDYLRRVHQLTKARKRNG